MVIQSPAWHEPKWSEHMITKEYTSMDKTRKISDPTELPTILAKMQETKQIIQNHYAGKLEIQNIDEFSYTYKGNFRPFGLLYPDGIPTYSSTSKGKTYGNFLQRAKIKVIAPNPLKKKRVMI
jgi:hypothetical protein